MPVFIVDGYNVTRGVDLFFRHQPHEERQVLLQFISASHPQGSSRNQVIVVFDGRPGRSSPGEGEGPGLRVVFSQEESADDWIKRRVDQASNPRELVVVTADKALSRWVRGAGARVVAPKEFISQKKSPRVSSAAPHVADRESITEELKKLWLKK